MKNKYYIQWQYLGGMKRKTKWEHVKEKGQAWSKGKLIDTVIEYGRMVKSWPWQDRWVEAEYKH